LFIDGLFDPVCPGWIRKLYDGAAIDLGQNSVKAPRRPVALALMVAAPVLWSTAGVVTRHVGRAGSFEMVFWRSLFASLTVGAVLVYLRRNPLRGGWPLLVSGALWAVMFTAFMLALTLTSTANTLVMSSVQPLITAALAALFLRDPVPLGTWLAAAAAALGIAWMFGSDLSAHTARDVTGMLVAFMVPWASAANIVILRKTGADVDMRPAVLLGGLISTAVCLPLALPFQANAQDLGVLAFLGIFQLGLPCVLFVLATRGLIAPEIALLALLEVVLGPIWAWLGADEIPGRATLAGGTIVLAALVVNELATFRMKAAFGRADSRNPAGS
jgi:drug/metabolite transporter (DMT)-like permease